MIPAINPAAFEEVDACSYVSAMEAIVAIARDNGFVVRGGSNCCGCGRGYISFEILGTDDYDEIEID